MFGVWYTETSQEIEVGTTVVKFPIPSSANDHSLTVNGSKDRWTITKGGYYSVNITINVNVDNVQEMYAEVKTNRDKRYPIFMGHRIKADENNPGIGIIMGDDLPLLGVGDEVWVEIYSTTRAAITKAYITFLLK